ncbi:Serine/threonine protein kinase [Singulisphaera sp. GP187]|nr:serine/threonine-protein kinase [Singulisphaera sp. GP187]SIO66153.1 Serine/threonine protein kinase [Singulisphaera sp. GP187]
MLGRGGMGVVYRAYDRKRNAKVALKTVQRAGPSALYRFKQEFRTLLDVSHPNLVNLYELVSDGDNWFFTMELVEGVDFLEYVREGGELPGENAKELQRILSTEADTELQATRPPDRHPAEDALTTDESRDPTGAGSTTKGLSTAQRNRLRIALKQLAEGVGALHDAGKLHRDIKPSNVMVTRSGRVVLLDFGLAAEQGRGGLHQSTADEVVGTAAYMAPEQAAGTPVSPASDWYSVGVVLYEALTGRLPFVGGYMQVLMDKQRYEPPPPSELVADVPDDLNALCVDLLRQRPEARPSGRDVLRRLGAVPSGHEGKPSSRSSLEHAAPLIGRERHRASLRHAFEAMTEGNTVLLFVSGRSGVGKSVLVQRFLTDLIEDGDAVVLAGRCYERESVPYKALDSLIDALSRYLRLLPIAEAKAILPRDVPPLTRVFPVLRRAQAVSEAELDAPRRAHEIPDPQELRRRAFTALRELLARLGDRKPLVLAIDDLQWGDVDSAALLSELLRPPDPPVLLLLASYRSEDAASSPFLQAFQKPDGLPLDRRELAIEALTPSEARDLALALIGPEGKGRGEQADAIARESGGNPLFVAELARHVQVEAGPAHGPGPSGGITLDEVLWQRISRLPDDARRLLEVIAVSSRPLRQTDACQCAERLDDERAAMGVLRSGRLIRGAGPTSVEEVETYHDRIRETVLAHLPPPILSDHHRRLARVLEASGHADPEALGVHFHGAGELDKAGRAYFQAAGRAAETLAFERAAALYRLSLECRPLLGAERRTLLGRLGDALANAGRGAEAAREYLEAASGATIAEALELQRRAAMQFLISGHVDDGLAAIRTVLEAVGMTLPSTPRQALVSLLLRRVRLRLRGLGFRSRDTSEVAAADLTRIDVCWSAAAGLSVVDTIRGADFQARGLLLALRAGEPFRIARSLAMEAAQAAIPGVSAKRRTARLLTMAATLAEQCDDPHALGLVTLARGVSAYLEGRWRDAQESSDAGEAILRGRCQGVAWELDTAHAFSLWSLSHLGEIAELNRRWPVLLKEARERGDLYAVMNLSTYIMAMVRLAADNPLEARDELRRTMSQWSRQGYHVQHNDELWAAALIELYQGDGPAAWKLVSGQWPALARSLLLRVQFIRTSMYFLRARCALAAATRTNSAELLKVAARDARHLEREPIPYAKPYSRLIRAGIAAAQGDLATARRGLADAAAGFDSVEMQLCAASARRALGELIGGDEGQPLLNQANAWMTAQGIRNPARTAAMYVTGF